MNKTGNFKGAENDSLSLSLSLLDSGRAVEGCKSSAFPCTVLVGTWKEGT